VALVVLCVFLAQNTQHATVHFLGFAANAPLAVLLLFAAALGAVMVAAAGLARIVELRNGRRRPPGRRPRRIAREPRGFGGAGGGKGLDHG
jgi:uncharacterized integral membrane protein